MYFSYYDEHYAVKFNYFDDLPLLGSEDLNFNTIAKINEYIGIHFDTNNYLPLLSIAPISVFQSNLDNVNLVIDPNSGNINDINYQINSSDVYEI